MRRTIASAALILCALCTGATAQNLQGDPAEGQQKAYTCTGCHGIPSYNNVYPTYHVPKLGGQNFEYIVASLQAYRSEERAHPTMQVQAGSLSDQDIADIAAYFVSLVPERDASTAPATVGNAQGADNANLQLCASCHGMDGNGGEPIYPKLAGQYADYMLHALRAYKDGRRQNPIMAGIVTPLTEQDMRDLAAYFSQQKGLVDLKID